MAPFVGGSLLPTWRLNCTWLDRKRNTVTWPPSAPVRVCSSTAVAPPTVPTTDQPGCSVVVVVVGGTVVVVVGGTVIVGAVVGLVEVPVVGFEAFFVELNDDPEHPANVTTPSTRPMTAIVRTARGRRIGTRRDDGVVIVEGPSG